MVDVPPNQTFLTEIVYIVVNSTKGYMYLLKQDVTLVQFF